MATLLAGLTLLVLALPPFFSFPWLEFWLLPLAAIYLFLLSVLPRLWLIVLPLATVGLDLAPITGRFAYNELDLVFLVTLASGLLYGRYRFKVFSLSLSIIVLFLYLLVIALSYSGWTFFVLPPRAAVDNPYYTSEYAYKVLKGTLWGVALVPMWGYLLAVDKRRAVNMLVTGMSFAVLVLGLIVLWERGTLGVILNASAWYHLVSSLLDLSTSYRVTGIFSDMHTGGEAFDGVLLLLLPACLYAVTYPRETWRRLLGAIAVLILAYIALVGFTRATYATFAIALALYGALTLRSRYKNNIPTPIPLVTLSVTTLVALATAFIAYRTAGSYALASYAALVLLAYAVVRYGHASWTRHLATATAAGLTALAIHAQFNSRWVEPSIAKDLLIGVSLPAIYVMVRRFFGQSGQLTEVNRVLILVGILLLPMIFAFALGGYQINDRATRISSDLDTRENHWRRVIASDGTGIFRGLVGNGAGSFPGSYIGAHPETVQHVGSLSIASKGDRNILRMGGGQDLILGQRVSIEPYTTYTANVHLRADKAARMVISLCERNLIYASNFMPNCTRKILKFPATAGAFKKYTLEINSERVGLNGALWRWPTVMTIQYNKPDTVIEIDAIDLSSNGFNVLRNSSFKRGLDYWFPYNDFSHLPWHVKNTYLQTWFESGWLGLGLFLTMIALLIRSNFKHHSYDSLTPMYTTGVLAICIFGLFGSPLDSARVSWIFFFFLGAGLARLRVRRRAAVSGEPESRLDSNESRSGMVKDDSLPG